MLRDNVRAHELVTSNTTPHVYRKTMLVVAFISSMWIITIPYLGVSCIVDFIAGKMSRYISTAPNSARIRVYIYSMTFLTWN